VTYAHKIEAADRLLAPAWPADELERTVRALRPHIGARVPLAGGDFLGVLAARVVAPSAEGLRVADGRLLFGGLELTEIRPPGGRPMPAADWLRGRRGAL
jgi:methionyl-tRNA formyltransferase